jgi:PIN like domain
MRIEARIVAERYRAGESVRALADDYHVEVSFIEDATGAKRAKLCELFTFFIDRSLGRTVVAEVLRGFGEHIVAHDDHFAQDTPDATWLLAVGERGWVVLAKDNAVRNNQLERRAIINALVACFSGQSGSARELSLSYAGSTAMGWRRPLSRCAGVLPARCPDLVHDGRDVAFERLSRRRTHPRSGASWADSPTRLLARKRGGACIYSGDRRWRGWSQSQEFGACRTDWWLQDWPGRSASSQDAVRLDW